MGNTSNTTRLPVSSNAKYYSNTRSPEGYDLLAAEGIIYSVMGRLTFYAVCYLAWTIMVVH